MKLLSFVPKRYAINYVVDQKAKKKVPFHDAVQTGLIDVETGNYVHNKSGETYYLVDAINRGFLKGKIFFSTKL